MTPCVTIDVTMRCPLCGSPFHPSGRRRYCSDACRQAAWRHRRDAPPTPTNPISKPAIVYECPTCDARYLGEQRCPDCNTFCRRLGPGGRCPHCDEAVAISDLTAEHPQLT
jgi:hypothetical protein